MVGAEAVILPPEFLQPADLHALTGRRQPAAWRRWLDAIGVRYVTTPRGIPLVYRDRLSPAPDASRPDAVLNLDALRKRRA